MDRKKGQWNYLSVLFLLIASALLLTARITYLYVADNQRFPINTVKITATYQHISHQQLEAILSESLARNSFFTLPMRKLRESFELLPWTKSIRVERIWPDTLKIILIENNPIAIWNDAMLTDDGRIIDIGSTDEEVLLPHLRGPQNQQQEVLQVYQKMSKILSKYSLSAALLEKRDNQAWELTLANGIKVHLGKRDLDSKIIRFCKAYPAVFSGKLDRVVSVDLRYPRGMAVKWNKEAGR